MAVPIESLPLPGRSRISGDAGAVTAMTRGAARVGAEILAAGGNAADAAVATALASGVFEPAMSGLGGTAYGLVATPAARGAAPRVTALDGSAQCPADAREDMFEPLPGVGGGLYGFPPTRGDRAETGPTAALPPTAPAVLAEIHARFGRLPFPAVVEPTLHLAEDGFTPDWGFAVHVAAGYRRLRRSPGAFPLYTREDGSPFVPTGPSDRLRLPELAVSLRRFAADGSEPFTTGDLARRLASGIREAGGFLTEADFARPAVREVEPLRIGFLGREVVTLPANSGGPTLAAALAHLDALGEWLDRDADSTAGRVRFLGARRIPVERGAWRRRIGLADLLHLSVRREGAEVVGAPAGQQLVEHHAQGVDVARRGQGFAARLFGTGVVGGHEAAGGNGRDGGRAGQLRADQFRDAEVDQLGYAVDPDHDVADLEVAVDHHMLVGEVHRFADLPEQGDALGEAVPVMVAVGVDRLAVDELHHEVGQAVFRAASVEQGGDVLVLAEHGQDLHLGAETPQQLFGGHGATEQLDRDLLVELRLAHGEIDVAHAAAALPTLDSVGPDVAANQGVLLFFAGAERLRGFHRVGQEVFLAGRAVMLQEFFDFLQERAVTVALLFEESFSFSRLAIQGLLEQVLQALPARLFHCSSRHCLARSLADCARIFHAGRTGGPSGHQETVTQAV